MNHKNLFESSNRKKKIENIGDPLKKLSELVDFEVYREELESMYRSGTEKGGRPPYDPVKMFKVVILQKLYNLSDVQTEFQLNDRRSFQQFIGVGDYESLPDAKTIWVFKERLIQENLDKILFDKLNYWIQKSGLFIKEGSIVDASIIQVPTQRNTAEENESIKKDETPEGWEDNARKFAQKDTDARWTKKYSRSYYGYKNHIMADKGSKLIRDYKVTPASRHDSQVYEELLEMVEKDEVVMADSAYSSAELKMQTEKHGAIPIFITKGNRSKKLSNVEREWNKVVSKSRCRVEHIFADLKSIGANRIRSIGIKRAELQIFLGNFVYNIRRFTYLQGARSV